MAGPYYTPQQGFGHPAYGGQYQPNYMPHMYTSQYQHNPAQYAQPQGAQQQAAVQQAPMQQVAPQPGQYQNSQGQDMNGQQNPPSGPSLFVIPSLDQLGLYPRDMGGNPQVFIVSGDDRLYARRVDIGTGETEFAVYARQEDGGKAQSGEQEEETAQPEQAGEDGFQALRQEIQAMLDGFRKEMDAVKEELKGEVDRAISRYEHATDADEQPSGADAGQPYDAADAAPAGAPAKPGPGRGHKQAVGAGSQPVK